MRRSHLAVFACALAACGGSGPSRPDTTDRDGDGFTVEGGDCNDSDASVRPGGGFALRTEAQPSGDVACVNDLTHLVRLTVVNNSCEPLAILSLWRDQDDCLVPFMSVDYTSTLLATSVPAAGEVLAYEVPPYQSRGERCCTDLTSEGFCSRRGPCTSTLTYTVVTSLGEASAEWSRTIEWSECPECQPPPLLP